MKDGRRAQAAARSVAPPRAMPARAADPVSAGAGWSIDGERVAQPRARVADRPAAELGTDTTAVLAAVSA